MDCFGRLFGRKSVKIPFDTTKQKYLEKSFVNNLSEITPIEKDPNESKKNDISLISTDEINMTLNPLLKNTPPICNNV